MLSQQNKKSLRSFFASFGWMMGVCAACAIAATAALAEPPTTQTIQKETIEKAFQARITPRGQQYFRQHFLDIIAANGFALDAADIDSWEYKAKEPIDLDKIPVTMGNTKTTLGALRDLIEKYITTDLDNPQPKVDFDGIHYAAHFGHFGLRIDPKSTSGKINKVIVDLEVELSSLSASVDQTIISDQDQKNQENIGNIGIKNFTVQSMTTAIDSRTRKPIMIRFVVPFEVTLDQHDGLSVKVLTVETNLPLVDIDWGYEHPLQLPEYVTYRVDPITGKRITEVSDSSKAYAEFEDQLVAKSRDLAKALQNYLKTYLAESGPDLLNNLVDEYKITSFIQNVYPMAPVAAPDGQKVPALAWGMIPNSMQYDQGTLKLNLDSFVEDPSAPKLDSLPSQRAEGAPNFSTTSASNYDLALGLDEIFINRMLQLSFDRGYFTNLKVGTGTITLTEAPYLNLDGSANNPHMAKIHASIEEVYEPTTWLEKLEVAVAVKNPVHVSFDLYTKLVFNQSKQQLSLVIDHIDTEHAVLDPDSAKRLYSKVAAAVKAKLDKFNQQFKASPNVIGTPLDLNQALKTAGSSSFYGIPIQVTDIQADSTGHLNVFAELKP